MNETTQPGPLVVRLSDQLGLAVNRALFDPACQRLNEWALIGPVQRAALESFAERLLAAEREQCAAWLRWYDGKETRRSEAIGAGQHWDKAGRA